MQVLHKSLRSLSYNIFRGTVERQVKGCSIILSGRKNILSITTGSVYIGLYIHTVPNGHLEITAKKRV